MKCPTCQVWTDVLETRQGRRRRQCANGHRFATVEILASEAELLERQRRLREARQILREKGYLA
jgi:transcriptional regulator NrdR family protein